MRIDLMSQYNYLMVNIKLANLFGLNVAAYWAELMNVYAKVVNKKFDETIQNNGFFEIDRAYITRRTTLSTADQDVCDRVLTSLEVLERAPKKPDLIRIDLEKAEAIILQDDPVELERIQKTAKIKSTEKRESKRFMIKKSLKDGIVETDAELWTAYANWIDAVYDSGNYLSKPMVEFLPSHVWRKN